MKPLIITIPLTDNNQIILTKEQFDEHIEKVYNAGFEDGKHYAKSPYTLPFNPNVPIPRDPWQPSTPFNPNWRDKITYVTNANGANATSVDNT